MIPLAARARCDDESARYARAPCVTMRAEKQGMCYAADFARSQQRLKVLIIDVHPRDVAKKT